MSEISKSFEENGYYIARGVFGGEFLARLQEDFNTCVGQLQDSDEDINAHWQSADYVAGGKNTVIIHTHQIQSFSAVWMQAFMDKDFLDITEEILGPDIVLHHSKLFHKPAGNGAPFPLHQDYPYFPTKKDSMIAAIIHLQDADEDNGCLRFVPGSHKLGRLDPMASLNGNPGGAAERFIAEHPLEDATPVIAKAGDVAFFHYFTLHGSMPNNSDRVRQTMLLQMHAGNDEMESEGHPYSGVVLRGRNWCMTRSRAASL